MNQIIYAPFLTKTLSQYHLLLSSILISEVITRFAYSVSKSESKIIYLPYHLKCHVFFATSNKYKIKFIMSIFDIVISLSS